MGEPMVWPVLSKEALIGFAGDVVKTIAPHTETDPAAILLEFLCCADRSRGRVNYRSPQERINRQPRREQTIEIPQLSGRAIQHDYAYS